MTLKEKLIKMIKYETKVINPGCEDEVNCKQVLQELFEILFPKVEDDEVRG